MKKTNFEGWYFKLSGEALTIAFIPEISTAEDGSQKGSLQVVLTDRAYFFEYPYAAQMKEQLYVVMGKNVFTDTCISLNFSMENLSINGMITFDDCDAKKFNVLGPLAFVKMPCKHAVLSMESRLSGSLNINGKVFDFTGGKGYLEKDWGTSFPKKYLWTQCNDFSDGTDTRISAAIAEIPFGNRSLLGCYACIEHGGKKYKMATYLGAKAEEMSEDGFRIRQQSLIFEGRRTDKEQGVRLKSPQNAQMTGETVELLECGMEYCLIKHGQEIFRLKSNRASFEVL